MRFLLDENFPRAAAAMLAREGHAVFDIRGSADEGAADKWLFAYAQELHAVLLTTDKDFYHTIPAQYDTHHGAIIIALRQPNAPSILKRFETALRFLQNFDLESSVLLLTDNRDRKSVV